MERLGNESYTAIVQKTCGHIIIPVIAQAQESHSWVLSNNYFPYNKQILICV